MKYLADMVMFARVVEAGGFSAAARLLETTTSVVSRSVGRLEAHIGGRLLSRSTRAVSVTELGRAVYAGCAAIAETAREVEAFAGHYARTPSGRLRVSAPVSYGQLCIAPQLSGFMAACPEIEVQLNLTDRIVDLVGEAYDVAIRIVPALAPGLVARPIATTATLLVASRTYLAHAGMPHAPEDLSSHPVVRLAESAADSELVLRSGSTEARVLAPSRLVINDSAAIVTALHGDLGIGLVPDYAARPALRHGSLVRVLPDWSLAGAYGDLVVQAIYTPTRHLPRKVRAFIDFFVTLADRSAGQRAFDIATARAA